MSLNTTTEYHDRPRQFNFRKVDGMHASSDATIKGISIHPRIDVASPLPRGGCPRAIACFKVGWDKLASSAGPPSKSLLKNAVGRRGEAPLVPPYILHFQQRDGPGMSRRWSLWSVHPDRMPPAIARSVMPSL